MLAAETESWGRHKCVDIKPSSSQLSLSLTSHVDNRQSNNKKKKAAVALERPSPICHDPYILEITSSSSLIDGKVHTDTRNRDKLNIERLLSMMKGQIGWEFSEMQHDIFVRPLTKTTFLPHFRKFVMKMASKNNSLGESWLNFLKNSANFYRHHWKRSLSRLIQ